MGALPRTGDGLGIAVVACEVVAAMVIGAAFVAEAGAIALVVFGAAPATEAIRAAAATDEAGSRRAVRRRNI